MIPQLVKVFGAICDRCGRPYLTGLMSHNCLCPSCYLGAAPATTRGPLIGDTATTGRRIV